MVNISIWSNQSAWNIESKFYWLTRYISVKRSLIIALTFMGFISHHPLLLFQLIQRNCWMLVTSRDLYDIWLQHCTPYPGQLFLWWDFRCSKVSSGANSLTLMVSINKSTNDYCVSNFISSFHVFRPWKKEVNRYWMDGWRDGWMDGWVRMHAYH